MRDLLIAIRDALVMSAFVCTAWFGFALYQDARDNPTDDLAWSDAQ